MVSSIMPAIFSSCLHFLYFGIVFCSAAVTDTDTLTFNNLIRDGGGAGDQGQTLVSANRRFQLGFFSPNNRSSDARRYVGIWYYQLTPRTIVWVANRKSPVSKNLGSGTFGFNHDGNLIVSDGGSQPLWIANSVFIGGRADYSNRSVSLLDSGNLVVREDINGSQRVLWQSFEEPTDTFLPGMNVTDNLKLTSWKNKDSPEEGCFTFQKEGDSGESKYAIKKDELPYWTSGLSGKFIVQDEAPLFRLLSNPTDKRSGSATDRQINYSKTVRESIDINNSRLVMKFDGKLQIFRLDNKTNDWSLKWSEPDNCSVLPVKCGPFSSCNNENRQPCKCLPGFKPASQESWNSGVFLEGCLRKSSRLCSDDQDPKMKIRDFVKLSIMKMAPPDSEPESDNVSKCRQKCLDNNCCLAYSYRQASTYSRDKVSCSLWTEQLSHVQEVYTRGGRDIYLRVKRSDIESTRRDCDVCGTNIISYPLSTGPSCGDPMYSSFECNNDTGEVYFSPTPENLSYRVTSINPEARKFSIHIENIESCRSIKSIAKKYSPPFFLSSECTSFASNSLLDNESLFEVEMGWNGPLEPTCNTSTDCDDWPNSSCSAAADGRQRCTCNAPFRWDSTKINCTLEHQESSGKGITAHLIFVGIIAAMIVILFTAYLFYCTRKRRAAIGRQENRGSNQGSQALRLYDSEKRVKDFIYSSQFGDDDKKSIELPCFDLDCIIAATDNFSDANKLGQGGFGPVYKGKFPGGQQIAIKRLSSGSGQGFEEFKNEVVLIAKLQHRNLVRLVGYCIEGSEQMLIYEYMPNKSLDSFIFDRTRCVLLNWGMRFDIIMGIARGMLYLHQDSRLRIIHRDLKTSNVLLDDEMNPKISDFGLARIVGGKETEATTKRVVGTYGYMSPEYALDGFFSVKSDVFSFGVVVLEIITGKRNSGFYQQEQALSLLGYAWKMWREDRALGMMDQTLRKACNANEFLRCVNVGLLCVQEDPNDRPTMSNVVFMLGSETASLPNPKQPAFLIRRSLSSTASTSSKLGEADPQLTVTLEEGR